MQERTGTATESRLARDNRAQRTRTLHPLLTLQASAGNRAVAGLVSGFAAPVSSPSNAPEVEVRDHHGALGWTGVLVARDVTSPTDAKPTAKAKVQRVGLEDLIRQVLQRNVTAEDRRGQKQRLEDLMELFRSMASPDREILRARLRKPAADDDLAQLLYQRLSDEGVKQVVTALSGAAVPVPESRLHADMVGFLKQLTPDKVLRASQDPVLVDAAWMRRVDVTMAPDSLLTPPPKVSGGITLRWQAWRETKVVEVPVQSGSATWSPAGSPRGAFSFTIDTPGQWVIEVEVLRQGALLKQFTHKLQARAASGAELAGAMRDKHQIADPGATVDAMSDAELAKQEERLRREQAATEERDPGGSTGDRAALDKALHDVEWARFERGAKLPDKLNVLSELDFEKQLPDDPVAMRAMFERLIMTEGVEFRAGTSGSWPLASIEYWFRKTLSSASSPIDRNSPRAKKLTAAQVVIGQLKRDIMTTEIQYEKVGLDVMKEMLKASETQLKTEVARYGMEWGPALEKRTLAAGDALGPAQRQKIDSKGQMEELPATAALEATLNDLKAKKKVVTTRQQQLDSLRKTSRTVGANPLYYNLSMQIGAAQMDLDAAWDEAVEMHPILARFRDPKRGTEFDTIAAGNRHAASILLYSQAKEIASNIGTARRAVDDKKFTVYDLPKAGQLAKLNLKIVPGSWRDVMLNERTQYRADMATWKAVIKGTFILALSMLAAAPTGGGSLGALGVLLLDAAAIYEGIDKYRTGKAAGKSSLDPRLSLSADDPSFVWVVVDCIAAGVDAAQLVGILRQAKRLRDLARLQEAGRISAETRELSEVLNQVGRKGGLKYSLGDRIVKEAASIEAAVTSGAHAGALGSATLESLAKRMGTTVDIEAGLKNEIRVHYRVDDVTKYVHVTGIKVGIEATVADVLLHADTVKLLERYNGAVGKIRRLWDDLKKVFGGRGSSPFPPGSEAYNSWHELQKLPAIIDARQARLGKGTLSAQADSALREDIQFIENEYAHHKDVVDRVVLERGEDFIAKRGNVTAKELKQAKYPPPPSKDYYYVRSPKGSDKQFYLRRVSTRKADPLRVEFDADGLPTGKFVAGEWTRAEKAEQLIKSWDKTKQQAFQKVKDEAILNYGNEMLDVVPLKGIVKTDVTIGHFVKDAQRKTIQRAFADAFEAAGVRNPTGQARLIVNELLSHPVSYIKGTDQLRAFNYRAYFLKGAEAQGDLHHWLPLYLGGDHRALIEMIPDAHKALHGVIDNLEKFEGLIIAPGMLRSKNLKFPEGAAILFKNGSVDLVPL